MSPLSSGSLGSGAADSPTGAKVHRGVKVQITGWDVLNCMLSFCQNQIDNFFFFNVSDVAPVVA